MPPRMPVLSYRYRYGMQDRLVKKLSVSGRFRSPATIDVT